MVKCVAHVHIDILIIGQPTPPPELSSFILSGTCCDCVAGDVRLCTSSRLTLESGCCLVVPHNVSGLRWPSGHTMQFVSGSWMWHYLRSSASLQLIRWQWEGCFSSQLFPAHKPFACTHCVLHISMFTRIYYQETTWDDRMSLIY